MITVDDLEALVLEAPKAEGLRTAFAPLDEKERAKLSAPAQKLFRQIYQNKANDTASPRLKHFIAHRKGAAWNFWNSAETRHATLALFALCPLSVLKKSEVRILHDMLPALDGVMRDRRPEWLDDWIAHDLDKDSTTQLDFRTLREWIRDGICRKPEAHGYYRLFAWYLMRTGFYTRGEVVPPITKQLLADPDLLADIEGLFRVETNAFNTNAWLTKGAAPDYETWPDALIKLAAQGQLDRDQVLQSALDGLTLDIKQNQLSGFHGFYKKMAPEAAELARHQPGYIDLLCHPVGHVVKFALEMLSEVEKRETLDAPSVLREIPAVFSGEAKGNALAALRLLKRISARDKTHAREALSVVAEALRHSHTDVQAAALDILEAHRAALQPQQLESVADAESFVAASNRARLTRFLGDAGEVAPVSVEVPVRSPWVPADPLDEPVYRPIADISDRMILRPEDAIAPIETIEALIEAILHAIEVVETPDEVERIIDAISRLAGPRPPDFDGRVAPILHRLKTGRGNNSIVVGMGGMGGALLDLLYTWLERRWYSTPSKEISYYTTEDGFVPVTAHVRAIAKRVANDTPQPLLSAPTHRGGWIDPLLWIDRLRVTSGLIGLDSMDLRLSLLRLAPDNRAAALARLADVPAGLQRVACFALGGDVAPQKSDRRDYAIWITAARCRAPYADWSSVFGPLDLDDALPDALRPAEYRWRASHKAQQHEQMRWKIPEFTVAVTTSGAPASAPAGGLLGRIGATFGGRIATEWSELPSAAPNQRMDRKPEWAGELNAPWLTQWLAFVWPQNPAAACMRGATRLVLRMDENSSSWTPNHGYFQALFQRSRPWHDPGHLLLALGLAGKDADASRLAADALIEGIDGHLFDPERFAAVLARLADGEWLKFNRLGDTLMMVAKISPLHATLIGDAIQSWLTTLDLKQKNVFRLLEVLVETRAVTGQPLRGEVQRVLRGVEGGGKLPKIAKQLLA